MSQRPFKEGDKIRCIQADEAYGLLYDSIYTLSGYDRRDLIRVKELDDKLAWYHTRFELFVEKKESSVEFKLILWDDWIEDIEKRIKEELKQDEAVATIELDDLLYGPSLDKENPQKFCEYHSFNNIYENYVFVTHHNEPNCYWYINGDGKTLIYKPQLA